ncbi:NUDIX hydrolase [Patescibacteria group bacterium]|nr:NUDIX hydrolase [Patescibacteria group bacterium]MBU1721428.1 NUDIX hydrolase [Patescibacteria group bacterium]MBU1901579.1 NUDIX hydrolase [Patescibacteria group bacterium]
MIYIKKPENFNARFDVVSCFVEHDEEILLLHRQDHKPQGSTWGVPAGKVDDGEDIIQTMQREIQEETGYNLDGEHLFYFDKVYVSYPDYDFVYHIFHVKVADRSSVVINEGEHKDFKWVSPKKALQMDLIQDEDACIELFYGI